ncbi:MAG: phosphodiester glycosidase family protein [Bacteroidales bacterium]|nr:phosphodiester glycosidase family protein [Bacteroidales bacterium]
MRKHFLLLFLLASTAACAQTSQREYAADSIAFVNALWQTDTMDGFLYRHYHFQHQQIFHSNQYINVIEIPRGSDLQLTFASDTLLTRTSEFAQRAQALAAINGSFFNMSTGAPVCFLKVNGKLIGENVPGEDTLNRKYYQNATIRLLRNGHPRFVIPDSNRTAEYDMPDSNVMTAGPMLLYKGSKVPQRLDRKFVYARHNRTAIGLKPDGTIVLVVVDGRHKKNSDGMSLPELTRTMRWLGCTEAANLDGGGSSTMYINGWDSGNSIVNHPSDNGRWDEWGQRPVANAILVVRPQKKHTNKSKLAALPQPQNTESNCQQ